jgi:hypothetical protein
MHWSFDIIMSRAAGSSFDVDPEENPEVAPRLERAENGWPNPVFYAVRDDGSMNNANQIYDYTKWIDEPPRDDTEALLADLHSVMEPISVFMRKRRALLSHIQTTYPLTSETRRKRAALVRSGWHLSYDDSHFLADRSQFTAEFKTRYKRIAAVSEPYKIAYQTVRAFYLDLEFLRRTISVPSTVTDDDDMTAFAYHIPYVLYSYMVHDHGARAQDDIMKHARICVLHLKRLCQRLLHHARVAYESGKLSQFLREQEKYPMMETASSRAFKLREIESMLLDPYFAEDASDKHLTK